MTDVTRILAQIAAGDANAADHLLPLVYDELRALARARLMRERPNQTLEATALVHEAYLRLARPRPSQSHGPAQDQSPESHRVPEFQNQAHFFAAAAEAMRRIIIDQARRHRRLKRGGDRRREGDDELATIARTAGLDEATLLSVHNALDQLAEEDRQLAEIVKMHIFLGMTLDEVGQALNLSRATLYRQWAFARAWLNIALRSTRPEG